jgi:3-dehydroquinate synthase
LHQIHVNLGKDSYFIYIDSGNLSSLGGIIKKSLSFTKAAIVTNPSINKLYGEIVRESLHSVKIETETIEVPDGEEYKSLTWAGKLFDAFIDFQITRQSGIIALGGGVIGDLAGFAAATFMRGITLVEVPTSLIAQVDSSVGGKTAVNHPKGKNLIGAFHQPELVFIDVDIMKTLPEREFKSGLAEVIKHGMIMDRELFEYIESNLSKILSHDAQSIQQIVSRSCRDKANIVEQDEREKSIRAILNYGHTIGHSIEAITDYNSFRHGEAVSLGMVVAAKIAVNMGILDEEKAIRQNQLLANSGLPTKFPDMDIDKIIQTIQLDKKIRENNKLRYILAKDIGKAIVVENVSDDQIRQAIKNS